MSSKGKARLPSVQSCDLGLISTGPCSTKLMTSNTSQQKRDSLKGAWGVEAEKDSVSLHTQSKAECNYQDVHADTKMLAIQPSGPLNQRPLGMNRVGRRWLNSPKNEFFLFSLS